MEFSVVVVSVKKLDGIAAQCRGKRHLNPANTQIFKREYLAAEVREVI